MNRADDTSEMSPDRPAAPILVVEDDDEVRRALVALLQSDGYTTVEAADGVSAFRLLRSGAVRPCLIVLDLMMPRMDGWDFCAAQQQDDAFASIPVVVMSAHPLASQAARLGTAAVLLKPADPAKILEMIAQHCASPL